MSVRWAEVYPTGLDGTEAVSMVTKWLTNSAHVGRTGQVYWYFRHSIHSLQLASPHVFTSGSNESTFFPCYAAPFDLTPFIYRAAVGPCSNYLAIVFKAYHKS